MDNYNYAGGLLSLFRQTGVLGQIGSAQAMFWEVQADYYRRRRSS